MANNNQNIKGVDEMQAKLQEAKANLKNDVQGGYWCAMLIILRLIFSTPGSCINCIPFYTITIYCFTY